jgi:hypothetical protein
VQPFKVEILAASADQAGPWTMLGRMTNDQSRLIDDKEFFGMIYDPGG